MRMPSQTTDFTSNGVSWCELYQLNGKSYPYDLAEVFPRVEP